MLGNFSTAKDECTERVDYFLGEVQRGKNHQQDLMSIGAGWPRRLRSNHQKDPVLISCFASRLYFPQCDGQVEVYLLLSPSDL